MSSLFLLPHRYRFIGWVMIIPSFILLIASLHFGFQLDFLNYSNSRNIMLDFDDGWITDLKYNNFTDEIAGLIFLLGLILVAFSRELQEDERIIQIRLNALIWAVGLNTLIAAIAIILLYNHLFLKFLAYNLATPLLLFVIRFRYSLHRDQSSDL